MRIRQVPARYPRTRPAFTLLEVLLATAIGVLLMGALYVAMNVQLRHAQAARDVVGQSVLARSLLARMNDDVVLSLQPPLSNPAITAIQTSNAGTDSSGTSTGSSSQSSAAATNTIVFNLGVQGSTNQLTIYISQVPSEVIIPPSQAASSDTAPPLVSDLRRITYWLSGDSNAPGGLARQEITIATTDISNAPLPPGLPDESTFVIAPEVQSLQFSYFDGTNWNDSWDGTIPGANGKSPLGPPVAIAITVGIVMPGTDLKSTTNPPLQSYRHVVAIATANGISQASQQGSSSSPQSSGSAQPGSSSSMQGSSTVP